MQRSSLVPLPRPVGSPTMSRSTLPPLSPSSPNMQRSTLSQFSLPVSPSSNTSAASQQTQNMQTQNMQTQNMQTQQTQNMQTQNMQQNTVEENLMKTANKLPEIQPKNAASEFTERKAALPLNTSLSRVKAGPSTVEFSTYQGVAADQTIEKALLERGFIATEKVLTKDNNGNVVCRFIKARDNLGHALYIELDTTEKDGMGYLTVSDNDSLMTISHDASVIPYSLKVGSFEASSSSLFGVGFECDNQVCVMSRKDNSLEPIETVFSYSRTGTGNDVGVQDKHPIPFPIVKMSEILANSAAVLENIKGSHARMRNIAFNSCMKDVAIMKRNAGELGNEVARFDKIATEVSSVLESTISDLENMHDKYVKCGAKTEKDLANLKAIRFNLNKRADLQSDFISLCHSMRERAQKIAVLNDEVRDLNNFAETLFTGLATVFTE